MTVVNLEDFDDTSDWTLAIWAQRAGRTGIGLTASGGSALLDYALGANQSDTVTMGFVFKATATTVNLAQLTSDSGATVHNRLRVTAGQIEVTRGTTTVIASASPATSLVAGQWYYVEWQMKLSDTVGTAIVRVDGATVLTATGLDTKNGGTKTVYDTVKFLTPGTSVTTQLDDCYIAVGAGQAFLGPQTIGVLNTVLHEPFNNLTAWTGTATIVAGRNGTAAQLGTANLDYAIPSGQQSIYVTLGFALHITAPLAQFDLVELRTATNNNLETLQCMADGSLVMTQPGTVVAPAGTVTAGAWQYLELQLLISTTAGSAIIRRNNTVVGSFTNLNVGSASPAGVVRFRGLSTTVRIDDLYLLTGSLAVFEGDQAQGPTTPTVKVYNGSAFVDGPAKVWNGSAFVDTVAVKTWNGSAFV